MRPQRIREGSLMLGFVGILVASLIVSIDSVALSVSIPTITDSLHADAISAYWAAISFVVGSVAFQPLFPALGAALGHRTMMIATLVVFIIGTIVCGTAQNVSALIAGRTIQGVGGGGILAMLYIVMADLFDLRGRATALAINGLVWLIGTATGPVLGGGFSSHVSWRWIFWIVLPIAGISLVMVAAFLNGPTRMLEDTSPGDKPTSTSPTWKQMDWAGAALLVASLASLLIPITWGGVSYAWNSWHTLVPLLLGVAGCLSWLVYEWHIPANPILPLSIFMERTTACAFVGVFVLGLVQFGLIFYLPLYYQIVKGYSALISGVALLPQTLVSGPVTMVAGILTKKTGKYNIIVWAGWTLLALGCGLLVFLDAETTITQWIFINAVSGVGMGLTFPSVSIASQAYVDQAHVAVASMLSPFIRGLGQAIGIAVGNSVVKNVLKHRLRSSGVARLAAEADHIAANVASPALLAEIMLQGSAEKRELSNAYVGALRAVWWSLFAVCCFAGLLSLAGRDMPIGTSQSGQAPSTNKGVEVQDTRDDGGAIELT